MHIHKERGWHFSLALPQSFLIWAHNMVASFCWQLRLSALLNKSFISDCFLTLEDVNFYTYILMQSNLDLFNLWLSSIELEEFSNWTVQC